MRSLVVLLLLPLLLLAAVPASAQEPIPVAPRYVVGDVLGNATDPDAGFVIANVTIAEPTGALYRAYAVERNGTRWEIPLYYNHADEFTGPSIDAAGLARFDHADPVTVVITDPTVTAGDMQYTGLSLAEALAGVVYPVEPAPGESSAYSPIYVVGDILGNATDPTRGSVVSSVYDSDGSTWYRVHSDTVRSGDFWMIEKYYNNDMAFTASLLDQNGMRRVAHADPHTVIVNDTMTSTGDIGWYRLSLAEIRAGKSYDWMGNWHFNTGDILGNESARYIVGNATVSDIGPSSYTLYEVVNGTGGWEIPAWVNGGIPFEVPPGSRPAELAYDLVDHTDPHFAIVTDPAVVDGVTYAGLSLGEILEGLDGYPAEAPGPVGGDRGYLLVSTNPPGAEIYLEDISGTRTLQGNTTAGPLNVTICLTCTPVRSLIASLAGYQDAVYAITQYPAKDQTVPVNLTLQPAVNGTPYRPHAVPGRVEAEDYDLGGEGVAYHDTTAGNTGGAYRADDVDIEKLAALSTPNVGWIRNGEWLAYTVNVTQNGSYTMTARVASPNAGRSIAVSIDGTPAGTIAVPRTGSFGAWQTVSVPVGLAAGPHTLNLSFSGDGQNLDWFELAPAGATPNGTPYKPLAIPGTIQAEDYDLGGEGVAYHDTTPGNEGGAYRQDDVDIEVQGGATNVGWIRDGEFLTYTATVASAGTYTMTARVASPNSGRTIAVEVDGEPAATVQVPNTGSFGTFRTVSVPVALDAGAQTLRLSFSGDGQNLDWLGFAAGGTPTPTPGTGGATFVASPTTAPHGSAFRFTVTPAAGKTIASAWWSFDAPAHLNTWNSRTVNPTFYYFVPGTYSPLVRLTYTDGTTDEVHRVGYIRST